METYSISAYTLILRTFVHKDSLSSTVLLTDYLKGILNVETKDKGLLEGIANNVPLDVFKALILNLKVVTTLDDNEYKDKVSTLNDTFIHNQGGIYNVLEYLFGNNEGNSWKHDTYGKLVPNHAATKAALTQGV
jgi:hypothetical protein